jgi:PAS domain S-box-containing protein
MEFVGSPREARRSTGRRAAPPAAGAAERHRITLPASVLDDCPEAVVALGRDDRLAYANPASTALFGVASAGLVGRLLSEFVAREGAGCAPAVATGALRGHFELRRPDGELRWVSYSASPLRENGDATRTVVVYLRDDTERRRDELRWTRRHDELEQTIRAVSHDLRSPLVAVLGFSRLLHDDLGQQLGRRGRHYVDRIAEAGRTMENLIRELLDFARIGHVGEQRALVDPREVLHQLRGELKPRLDELGVQLELPEEPPLLHCDRTRLYQLLSNLVGNALDHMGPCPRPRVEVAIRADGFWHHVQVRDNGRGIEAQELERVFDVFHTIPREGGRRGTGIGLAIVKKIAELHGGRVWVESQPGAGATFHVQLPRP